MNLKDIVFKGTGCKETPVVFASRGQQVVGMLHMPTSRRGRVPAVVFYHGFTGNRTEAHRIFVKMARALAKAGIASLRFDFRGSGDSAGDFSDMTLSGEITDARAALRFIRKQRGVDPDRIGILGMSMGGLVASYILGEDKRIRAGVLWSAVAQPAKLALQRLTKEARKQLNNLGCIDYSGFPVGRKFVTDVMKHRPLSAIVNTRAPIMLIHGDQDETVPVSSTKDYARVLSKAHRVVSTHIVAGADHTYKGLAFETQVIGLTLEWFGCNLPCEG